MRKSNPKEVKAVDYYEKSYTRAHYAGFLGAFTNGYHKSLERGAKEADKILEVGAGEGEHLNFVSHKFLEYFMTDLEIRNHEIPKVTDPRFNHLGTIHQEQVNAEDLPYGNNEFQRLVSTCLLHHLSNPDKALEEWRRVVSHGGQISIYLPHDPGVIYRWVRHWFSHHKIRHINRSTMKDVKILWSQEHRNHYLSLYYMICKVFENDIVVKRNYPIPLLSWNLNLYSVFQITISKVQDPE